MYSFGDPAFWGYFFWFWFCAVLAFIIPGYVLLKNTRLPKIILFSISIPLGISLWAWQGFVFGYLGARWLSYVYILVFLVLWLTQKPVLANILVTFKNEIQSNKSLFSVLVVGVFAQMSIKWFTLMRVGGSLIMCCSDLGDDIWYTSIAKNLVTHFPPIWPGLGDVPLTNYHYWSNLIVADMARVFQIPIMPLQFQYLPLLLSLTLGLSLIGFGKILTLAKGYTLWLLFFVYLGGDALHWTLLILGKGLNQSMSSLEDGVRFLGNLPRAYSIIVYFGSLNLWLVWWKKQSKLLGLILVFMFASLAGLKIYFAIFMILGLGCIAIYDLLFKHRIASLIILVFTVILSLAVYLPTNTAAGGFFYTGFWAYENFIMQPGLRLERLEMARIIFQNDGKWYRVAGYDLLFFIIYVVSIFGTKLLAFIQTKKTLGYFPVRLHILLLPAMAVSFILGGFFQQNVGGSNTFNFLVIVFIVMSVYTAMAVWYLTGKLSGLKRIAFLGLILVLTLPRAVHEVTNNINRIFDKPPVISKNTEGYADYIRNFTPANSVFLVNNREYTDDRETTIVHFLTDRKMYFSGKNRLAIFNTDTFDRERTHDEIFLSPDPVLVGTILEKSPIDYILATSSSSFVSTDSAEFLEPVYHNDFATLYRVSRGKIRSYLQAVRPVK